MSEEVAALVRHRVVRARETIEDARLLLDAGRVSSAVNRLYYAAFYGVSAALLARGLSSSKHSGVRALFHHHLVKSGMVPIQYGKLFDLLFLNRHKGDYADFVEFQSDEVRAWCYETERFLAFLESTLSRETEMPSKKAP